MKYLNHNGQKGQALITLLIFMLISITVMVTAIGLSITQAQSSSAFQGSSIAFSSAESGGENAVVRLLRDPNYTGETLPVGEGTAIISVTGTPSEKTIHVKGTYHSYIRTIEIKITYTNDILTVVSWKEISS